MQSQNIDLIRSLFQNRLATLEHLLKSAQAHFGDDESFLQKRNFYFHLVTAYDILRMAGVPLGKRDYMLHLVPLIRQG